MRWQCITMMCQYSPLLSLSAMHWAPRLGSQYLWGERGVELLGFAALCPLAQLQFGVAAWKCIIYSSSQIPRDRVLPEN